MNSYDVSDVRSGCLGEFDLFMCSGSFESRCLGIPAAIAKTSLGGGTGKVLVAFNENYGDRVSENVRGLVKIFGSPELCRLRSDDPIFTADSLLEVVDAFWPRKAGARIAVDITAFTRESLLMLLQVLWRRKGRDDEVMFLYLRAEEYDVGSEDDTKWLSQGIAEVRSVVGYPGDLLPSRGNHLIVMAGFEHDRAVRLVTECEPAVVSLGVADPADPEARDHQGVNERSMRRIRNVVGPVHEFRFSGYDAYRAAEDIKRQIREIGEGMNTIVAPMNTKIATVGAGIVGLEMPEVQLCYAQVDLYNYDAYSEAGDTVYVFRLGGSGGSSS